MIGSKINELLLVDYNLVNLKFKEFQNLDFTKYGLTQDEMRDYIKNTEPSKLVD